MSSDLFRFFTIAVACAALPLSAACGVEPTTADDESGMRRRSRPSRTARSRRPMPPPSTRTPGTNTQSVVPDNIRLADIDGDGRAELVQFASNKIFVRRSDFAQTGMLHAYLPEPIAEVIAGDFRNDGKDWLCAALTDGSLRCYGASPDHDELWWVFTRPSFITSSEDVIVADYDANGRDDLLLYNRDSGGIRLFTMTGDFGFDPMPGFFLGSLSTIAKPGMQLRAGDFDGDGRYDILAVDGDGRVSRHDSRVFSGSKLYFSLAFQTASGLVDDGAQITTGRLDANARYDVSIRDVGTGHTTFYAAEASGSGLQSLGQTKGQLGSHDGTLVFWTRLRDDAPVSSNLHRDDALVFHLTQRGLRRVDAVPYGTSYTYHWIYNRSAPNNHYGWAPFQRQDWMVLKCRFNEQFQTKPHPLDLPIDYTFAADEPEGVVSFWRDMSYGSWDLSAIVVDPNWHTMPKSFQQATQINGSKRWVIWNDCVDAAGVDPDDFAGVAVFQDKNGIDSGSAGTKTVIGDEWALIDAPPAGLGGGVTWAAHEMGHAFDWDHSEDQAGNGYGDQWDIMSAMNVKDYVNANGLKAGPAMNAPLRSLKSFIPAQRIRTLVDQPGETHQIVVASIDRPEASGALTLRLGTNPSDHYEVELRLKEGWDQGIPADTVLVHRVFNGRSQLITAGSDADMASGATKTLPDGTQITVKSIDVDAGTATVEISF